MCIRDRTYLRIAGGQLDVTAADDALHSDLEGIVAGGALTIEAGDDAFHAETKLVIDGGTVDVTSCYEGYEAEKIYVNGGETHIVASDDAVNAAAADLSGDEADATATTTDARVAESFDPAATGEMSDGAEPPAMDAGAMPQDGAMPGGMGGAMGEREDVYKRQPPADVPRDLRITFDERIAYRDLFAPGSSMTPLLRAGEAVMEVKASGPFPLWLVEALDASRAYPTSFSKYGAAYCACEPTQRPVAEVLEAKCRDVRAAQAAVGQQAERLAASLHGSRPRRFRAPIMTSAKKGGRCA